VEDFDYLDLPMRRFFSITLASAAIVTGPVVAQSNAPQIKARTAYHTDGTYTESIQDPFTREQRETTYNAQKVKIAERVYLLNERGVPVQGNVYDGRGQLKARVQVLFDAFGRTSEQRMMNLQGEVYQRIVFEYDAQNKQLPPKSINYNVTAPDMKPATIDLTGQGPLPNRLDRSQGAPTAQGNVPMLSSGGSNPLPPAGIGPNGPLPDPTAEQPSEKKKGFFGRLFSREKKEEK
jgi:hypothetical protein